MSPTPLIELQRRLTLVGAIRAGGEKQPKAPGRKLEAFRLTSPRRQLVEQAAELYGGSVSPWESPTGKEWQVFTEAEELPVLLMPGYSLRQSYELWEGATKRLRLCDGEDEELSGGPCLCNAEGRDQCDLYTRLVVALPELDTVLGWRLITRGLNAAHELPTMMALLEARGAQTFVPARLRLDQRRGVKDGQVLRFVVPTIDLGIGYLALAAPAPDGQRALPPANGFTPAARREPTIEQALSGADSPPARRGGRRAAPHGPDSLPAGGTPPTPEEEPQPEQTAKLQKDEPMWKKLNVLVGQLRDGEHITTENVYDAVAKMREMGGEELVIKVGGYDEKLELHWSPLRDDLTRLEAHKLIDRLSALEAKVKGAGGQPEPEGNTESEGGQEAAEEEKQPVPFNQFPPGY